MLLRSKFVCVALSLLVISGGIASAMEDASVDVSLDYFGKYIWRGQVSTDDPVFQPAVSVGMDKLTLGVWGNMDTTNINRDRYEFTEVDYTLDYTDALPGVDGATYSAGAIHYSFPTDVHGSADTTEIYAGLGYDCILNPTATLYWDIDEVGGFYASLGISHSLDLAEYGLTDDMVKSLDLAASLGCGDRNYNNDYWGNSVDAINDLVISATVPVELCSNSTLNVSCNYVSLLDSSIKRPATSQKSDYVYGGVGLAMSF